MKQKITISVLALGTILLLSGCGISDYIGKKAGEKMVEKSIESQTGGKVDVNTDNGRMNIKSNEGDFSMSGDGTATLSADFPKDIFIAPDAKIQFSMANGKEKSYSVAYITSTSVSDIYARYKSDLEGRGWAADSKTEMTLGESKISEYKKGTQSVSVIVGPSQDEQWQGKTSVQVTGSDDAFSGASRSSVSPDMPAPDEDKVL